MRANPARFGAGSRAVLCTAGSSFLVYGLALLTGPLLARSLGDTGRGSLAAVLVPTQLLSWLVGAGVPMAAAYYASTVPRRQLMASAWAVTALFALPVVVVVGLLAPRFLAGHDPVTVVWFRVFLATIVVLVPAYAALDYLNGSGDAALFNRLRHLAPLANALGLLIAWLVGGLTLPVALGIGAAANVGSAFVVLAATRSFPGRGFRRTVFASQLRYGARVVVGDAAHLAVGRLDQVLMVSLVAPSQLGVYAVAATAAAASGSVANGLGLAMFPRIRNSLTTADRQRATRRALLAMVAVSGLFAALLAVAAPLVLPWLFGANFRAAVRPLWFLLPGQICFDAGIVLGTRLQADGRPGSTTVGHLVGAAITVVGVYPAVQRFGIEGAAAVTSLSQAGFLVVVCGALAWMRNRARRWPAPPPPAAQLQVAVAVGLPAGSRTTGLWFANAAQEPKRALLAALAGAAQANGSAHANGSVNGSPVANGAVNGVPVANGAVANGAVANGAVANGAVANGAVSNGAMANRAVANGAPGNGALSEGGAMSSSPHANEAAANGAVSAGAAQNGAAPGSAASSGVDPGTGWIPLDQWA